MLGKLLKSRPVRQALPAAPPGLRVYAIGDVHGRLDLLDDLLGQIEADERRRDRVDASWLVFLGDLVDRGPDSSGVVERVRQLAAARPTVRCLMGNHEEIMLAALAGDTRALRLFCRVGGRETLISYGLDPSIYERADYEEIGDALTRLVPVVHRQFLSAAEDMLVLGDYAFVHAGLRPGVAIEDQRGADLRWIREGFLDHRGGFGKHVVHGHTVSTEVEATPFRTGIDTGAYASDRLSAVGLEGSAAWVIQTGLLAPTEIRC